MNQELLDLAREIDDNEDAIADALEAEDFDTAAALTQDKVALFRRLNDLAQTIEDKTELNEYLKSLLEVTVEQRDLLDDEFKRVRQELYKFQKGSKGKNQYSQVDGYGKPKSIFE
ncbi:MAG: flagellar protein FliT [Anaerobiospirillum succiniciproducens]|uniref:flagellar protein FliT n=1 Tax=Anaerobiospirillum succiniciproducens TaxID=13335 RepID=UPI0004165F7F|nr:flagellar protein FliT [Anaerobiospirillum succiniciproducens]MCI6864469.1 flagellar protein FliT [Anaerobiospirillum succiniciproducens]MDO4675539.1 flagellar protein FliT [Anaerobiospirillum succiniciproducens]MDY2798317.1 flagellar protein FliT [Anaerobiospirillum succiniciproducens]